MHKKIVSRILMMVKIFQVFIFSLYLVSLSNAQSSISNWQDSIYIKKKFYSRASLGYGFITGAGENVQRSQRSNGSTAYSKVPFSYGKGLLIQYGVGYSFNQNIAAELNLSYLIGSKSNASNTYRYDSVSPSYIINQLIQYKANMLRINPCITLSAAQKLITPYLRFGLVFGLGNGSTDFLETYSYTSGRKNTLRYTWDLVGLQGMGYNTALGVKFKVDQIEHLFVFAELSHQNIWGKFDKAHMSAFSVNGQDQLSYLTTSEKETIFKDEYSISTKQDSYQPSIAYRYKYIFDSIGFNLGLIVKI